MAILLSELQYIWIPKDSLVITEKVTYILRSAHGRSVDGTGAVTLCVAWLKDLFGGVCCRSRTAHTVGALLCLPDLCCRFDYNFYLRDQEMLLMAWTKSKRFYLSLWWKLLTRKAKGFIWVYDENFLRSLPTLHLKQPGFLFSEKKILCFSATVFHPFL